MPAKSESPKGEGRPSQEPLVDSEGYEKPLSRSASRKRKKAAAKSGNAFAAVGLVIANMVMGAESFILAGQTSFLSNTTSPNWDTNSTMKFGSYIPQINGLAYAVTKISPKKILTWDSQATMMAEWQELKGVGPSQGRGVMSASSLEDMQNNRDLVVIEFSEKQSRSNASSLY